MSKPGTTSRIDYLDGFRGMAILLVALFHAYSRWPAVVPYGSEYGGFFLAKFGWMGVELFFMISGFVIFMTLEKCESLGQFAVRRWLRLFPAMLIGSLLVFLTSPWFPERPSGIPAVSDLIPGLLFVEPIWISAAFGHHQGVLEGSFWSLFVEVKFYAIFGLLFFWGRRQAKLGLAALFGLAVLVKLVTRYTALRGHPLAQTVDDLFTDSLSFGFFIWFLIGVLAYEYHKSPSSGKLVQIGVCTVLACAYASVGHGGDLSWLFGLFLVTLFVGSVAWEPLRRVISNRLFLFLGFVSYPFYLIHENLLVAMTAKVGQWFPWMPGAMMPAIPFLVVLLLSYGIARFAEPWLRSGLRWGRGLLARKSAL